MRRRWLSRGAAFVHYPSSGMATELARPASGSAAGGFRGSKNLAAYSALQGLDLKTAWREVHSHQAASSKFLNQMAKMIEDRCRSVADKEVDRAI